MRATTGNINDATTVTATLTSGISNATGNRAFLIVSLAGTPPATAFVTGVTDTKSNSWTVDGVWQDGNGYGVVICSAPVTTTLTTSDTLTITWSSSNYTVRTYILGYGTGCATGAGPTDTSAHNNTFGTNVTISATAAAHTLLIAAIKTGDNEIGRAHV